MNGIWKSFDFFGNGFELLELFREEPRLFFLDSSQSHPVNGRYSFIGFDPFDVFSHKGKGSLDLLKKKVFSFSSPRNPGHEISPLISGAVGYIGYDYGLHQENICLRAKDDLCLPDCFFGFYDCILTIDHFTAKLHVSCSGLPEKSRQLKIKRALWRLDYVTMKIFRYLEGTRYSLPIGTIPAGRINDVDFMRHLSCNFSKQQYLGAVKKALEYISRGDIYQVNLSQRFLFEPACEFDPLDIYARLRNLSPSAFSGYLDCGDFQIVSSSPERFLKLKGCEVQTVPMKGTIRRGKNAVEDKKLMRQMLNSPKEKAELLMITDLHRNDLGRVCNYGSVKVEAMRTLEEYKTVFQATSVIKGVLREGEDCFSLIRACFPGGSITGCPKIRAMEIIEELEPVRRAIYTGSLGYINFAGDMDFNIIIRTVLVYKEKLYFQVGGGIVADSTPEGEYNETLVKAGGMFACLKEAFYGKKDYFSGRRDGSGKPGVHQIIVPVGN